MSPMDLRIIFLIGTFVLGFAQETDVTSESPPEGYYAFVESPSATPPRVRPPPYRHIQSDCPGILEKLGASPHNLCGDLNRGLIPRNPLGQGNSGEPYPFELIRNHTLKFLSRTLPILRADDTLPRVAQLQATAEEALDSFGHNDLNPYQGEREKREIPLDDGPEHRGIDDNNNREARKFCDGGGVFCMLYRAINGEGLAGAAPKPLTAERRDEPQQQALAAGAQAGAGQRYEGPPTPCPAKVEYATPVFAKNYQGVWRYVVQIPYEGYFTQTIEVTRCMQSRCHYLEGGCLSSPRWVSMLVAELHYPRAVLAAPNAAYSKQRAPLSSDATTPPPVHDFQAYQQYLQKRAGLQAPSDDGLGTTEKPPHCDGHDELGCFQVRLYYDWFLVPGSCKCWRPDYFARYVRRKTNSPDL